MTHPLITQDHIDTFQKDGVVMIKGLFADEVVTLREGVARNMSDPGPYAAENLHKGEAGRFFDDYCNWSRIPEFENVTGKYGGSVIKNPVAAFAAMMTHMDEDVGRILDLLSELGISDDTLVMFTSDNGPHKEGGHKPDFFDSNGPLKGYKRDLYEGGIRVATLARWSGKIKPGSKSSHVAAGWDLLPTVCELAGIKSPKGLDGVSFAPTLLGQSKMQKKRDYLYWEFHERGGKQAVRMGKWKGIRLNVRKNPNSPIELYDLSKDIGEENNLAGEYPQIVKKIEVAMRDSHIESDVFTFLK